MRTASTSLQHFAEHAATHTDDVNMRIFAPVQGEDVDITAERNIYQIKLRDALVASLQFSVVGDVKLSWVDGVVVPPPAHLASDGAGG